MSRQSDNISKRPFVIAVTGGIASGKTTVCNLFRDLFGIDIIDTDELSKEAVSKGSDCLKKIVKVFGDEVLAQDENLNRPLMKKIIFQNASRRKQLENIVHPVVRELMLEHLKNIRSDYSLLGIPLLNDRNRYSVIDRVLVVDCEEEEQIKRASLRDDLGENQIKKIISSQLDRDKRLEIADDIIINKGDKCDLETYVKRLNSTYIELSKAK